MMRRRKGRFARPGLLAIALLLALGITGIGYGAWTDEIYIEGTVTTGEWDVGGSMGFWRTWWTHYSEEEMTPWLGDIDAASRWLGPTTVQEMDELFAAATGPGATMRNRFTAHYMATRLSIAAGRLSPGNTHDITGIEGYSYLGLPDPASATLSAIVIAIEGKHPADPGDEAACWPNTSQYETMKDICDAINNLQT
ncbi:MAG: hypothetical protein R6U93_02025 [Dehalococcoidia bacterium]